MKYVIFSHNLNMNVIELHGMITYSKTMYTAYEWVYCFKMCKVIFQNLLQIGIVKVPFKDDYL